MYSCLLKRCARTFLDRGYIQTQVHTGVANYSNVSASMSKRMSKRMSTNMSEHMSEHMSKHMSKRMS